LKEAELKGENLQNELKSLEFQKKKTFKSPPREWVDRRLEKFHETLSKKTTASALALKEVLGEIKSEAITENLFDPESIIAGLQKKRDSPRARCARLGQSPFSFKPYYAAHTKIRTLALFDNKYKGSN